MSAAATYDLQGAIDTLFPGAVLQRQLMDAAAARYAAKGAPLDSSDVAAILAAANGLDLSTVAARYAPTVTGSYGTALPAYPAGLPRFQDSNPSSFDDWSIDRGREVL